MLKLRSNRTTAAPPLPSVPLYAGFSRSVRGSLWGRWLTWMIAWFTDAGAKGATHAFLLYHDDKLGWRTLGANSDGVSYISLKQFLATREIVALFLPRTGSPGSLWDGLAVMRKDIGLPYDYSGVVGMAMVEVAYHWFHDRDAKNPLAERRALFCSEFLLDWVRASGFAVLKGVPVAAVDPERLETALRCSASFKAAYVVTSEGALPNISVASSFPASMKA